MTLPIDATAVKGFAPFADLAAAEAETVARLLEFQTLPAGETLFRQGDASDTVYLIVSGEMEILLQVPNYDDHHLVTFGPGVIFGEVAPLAGESRTATARALTEANLARMPWSTIESAMENGDRWAAKFLFYTAQLLARRLRAVDSQLAAQFAQIASQSTPHAAHAEDELESLRKRLLRDWSF